MKIPIHVWRAFVENKPISQIDDKSLRLVRKLMKMREDGKLSEIAFVINRHNVLINLKRDPNSIGQKSMTL